MSTMEFDLYLDESGDFGKILSFVGGVLVPSRKKESAEDLVGARKIHTSENYNKKEYPEILQSLRGLGGHFVIFRNPVTRFRYLGISCISTCCAKAL